jgi:predicted GNAT family acetyltransferase
VRARLGHIADVSEMTQGIHAVILSAVDGARETVTHEHSAHRFVFRQGAHLAKLNYRRSGESIRLVHTEVPEELGGHGVGSMLARAALDYARAEGLRVIPDCPFVAGYLERHPEYRDLIA